MLTGRGGGRWPGPAASALPDRGPPARELRGSAPRSAAFRSALLLRRDLPGDLPRGLSFWGVPLA